MGLRVGPGGRLVAPGYSECIRCQTPWLFVREHTTWFGKPYGWECNAQGEPIRPVTGSGCCPLCEACWKELTPEERLPFYERMYVERWHSDGDLPPDERRWPAIREAVLAGW